MKRLYDRGIKGVILLGTLLMVIGLTSAPPVRAENSREIYIAGREGAGDTCSSYGEYEQEWYYDDGYSILSNGESVWQNQGQGYDNNARAKFTLGSNGGVLELDGYQTYGTCGYVNNNDLYGIYYKGDLTIILKGSNELKTYRSDSFRNVYGIYVWGNLTIIGSGNLYVDMQANHSMPIDMDAMGIYCSGKLTIENGNPYIKIESGSSSNGSRLSYGIKCNEYMQMDGTIKATAGRDDIRREYSRNGVSCQKTATIEGGMLLGHAGPASNSAGLEFGSLTLKGGTVIGEGSTHENGKSNISKGIVLREEPTLVNGTLKGFAGRASEISMGIEFKKGVHIPENSTVVIEGRGLDAAHESLEWIPDYNFGINAGKNTEALFQSGKVTAISGNAKKLSRGLEAEGTLVISGNAEVTAESGASLKYSEAITSSSIDVSGSPKIYAKAEGGATTSIGISSGGRINVTGGEIYAEGNYINNADYHCGVGISFSSFEVADFVVSGGNVTCVSNEYGIFGKNNGTSKIIVTGGTLLARGEAQAIRSGVGIVAPYIEGSVFSDGTGAAVSDTVSENWHYVLMEGRFTIAKQPEDWYGIMGKKAKFSVEAAGNGLTYQWQYKKGSGEWTDYAIATANTANFQVTMNEKNIKWTYRCVITDASGKQLITNEVRMYEQQSPDPQLNLFRIVKQPADWYGVIGKKASFEVAAVGAGLTYRWQYKKGTAAWMDYAITTADTANLKVTMNEKTMKWSFRCVITDISGKQLITDEVRMHDASAPAPDPTPDAVTITGQPADWYGTIGKKASFNVTATGPNLTYQWQYKKGSGEWTNYAITTADTANLKVTMNEKTMKWSFRCVITDGLGNVVTTNEVHMYLATN